MKGQELKRRLRATRRKQAELADFMTRELGYPVNLKAVSRIVTGERQKISVEENAAIEKFFGGADIYFAADDRDAEGKIPLYGMAAGGNGDGIAYGVDSAIDWLNPPILHVDAAFRVAGSSMEPRLYAGETVFVKMGVPPKRGDDTVVELKDEAKGVIIKTFEKSADGFIFLRQWNPQQEVRLKAGDVRAMHAVRLRG